MNLAQVLGAVLLLALLVYALTGGADFGGGVWDLLARGPRAKAQRQLIEQALAPVWEANHVWLIFAVVLMFTAFPLAFATLSTALHVPLTVMLLGIVLRGSAFVFRQYGGGGESTLLRWGRVFAIASVLTPVCLGVVLGAVAQGFRITGTHPVDGFITPWFGPFPFTIGALVLVLFAFIAAVYLTLETADAALQADFRRRALTAAALFTATAGLSAWLSPTHSQLRTRLFAAGPGALFVIVATAALAFAVLALWKGRYALARIATLVFASAVVLGFGYAQAPYFVAHTLTLEQAAAPRATLEVLLPVLGVGAVVLLPSLYLMLRILKRPYGA